MNWDDLESNSLATLKREAKNLNINVPPRASKKQIIQMLSEKVQPTFVSLKFLEPSDNSQEHSQHSSSRASPRPIIKENPVNKTQTFNTPKIRVQSPRENVEEQVVEEKEEKRQLSPVFPSSSSKKKNTESPHNKTNNEERRVRYTNIDHSNQNRKPLAKQDNDHFIPKNIITRDWITGISAVVFALLGILSHNPISLVFSLFFGVLFYFSHVQYRSILQTKSHNLAKCSMVYLKEECNGSAYESQIKSYFQADSIVVRHTRSLLVSRKAIKCRDRSNGDKVWTVSH